MHLYSFKFYLVVVIIGLMAMTNCSVLTFEESCNIVSGNDWLFIIASSRNFKLLMLTNEGRHLSFSQNSQNWQYWHHRFFYVKTKNKSSNKMLPQWTFNLGPQPLRSDALLSELNRHVLLGRAKIFIWSSSIWFSLNDLSPRLKWCRNKR